MAKPNSRSTLQDYCLRNLGAPVIEINVDEDQLEDRTDDAIQFYQEYHSDAVIREYIKHQLTATDITNSYITVADSVTSVVRMLKITGTTGSALFDMGYHMRLNDIFMLQGLGTQMQEYVQAQQKLSLVDHRLQSEEHIRFSRHMNRLHSDEGFGNLNAGDYTVLEVYSIIAPDTYVDVYNDLYLTKYLTALIKRQWGANMIKFGGTKLPGGIELNGRQYYDDGEREIADIRSRMAMEYELPPLDLIG